MRRERAEKILESKPDVKPDVFVAFDPHKYQWWAYKTNSNRALKLFQSESEADQWIKKQQKSGVNVRKLSRVRRDEKILNDTDTLGMPKGKADILLESQLLEYDLVWDNEGVSGYLKMPRHPSQTEILDALKHVYNDYGRSVTNKLPKKWTIEGHPYEDGGRVIVHLRSGDGRKWSLYSEYF